MQYWFQAFLEATRPLPNAHTMPNASILTYSFSSPTLCHRQVETREHKCESNPILCHWQAIKLWAVRSGGGASLLQNVSQECKISAKFQASTFSPDKRAIVLESWALPGSFIKVCLVPRRIRMPELEWGGGEGGLQPPPPFFVRGHGGSALRHSSRERHFENYCRTERSVHYVWPSNWEKSYFSYCQGK
jgi:hypothetical protein